MRRRDLMKGLAITAAAPLVGFRLPVAAADAYAGKLLVSVQADGGWDPTSFCDPKTNQRDEPVINHWAEDAEPDQAGHIPYAPFANNKDFFDKHHDKMLVINGVDAQTNSHTTGIVHNWSGRTSEGYPTTTALLAGHLGEGLPVPYISFGGYSETSGTTRFTRMNNAKLLRDIANPTFEDELGESLYIDETDWATLKAYRIREYERSLSVENLLPMEKRNRAYYDSAFEASEALKAYADAIPPEEELEEPVHGMTSSGKTFDSSLRRQAQLTVLAFKTGVAVSADLWQGFFDTHATHDPDHEWLLRQLTDGVDCLWRYAEEHDVADNLVVVIGSDFGRTNHYNADEGKDHWPIGSLVIMEKGQTWTDRVVGETDELHFARQKIDPQSLEPDDNGTLIHPKHVHKALRRYLGIEDSDGAQRFPFDNVQDFAFFGDVS
ncbi:MAG: DUF1501 domain-containing protein [Gammaproteobacteria bacterium]|nr:DUF1501 domain-containing protein [Gammaproteobacteria bacterium]